MVPIADSPQQQQQQNGQPRPIRDTAVRVERAVLDTTLAGARSGGRVLAAVWAGVSGFVVVVAHRLRFDSAGGVAAWGLRLTLIPVLLVVAAVFNAEGARMSNDFLATPLRKTPGLESLANWRETYKLDWALVVAAGIVVATWIYTEVLHSYLRFPPERFSLGDKTNLGFGLAAVSADLFLFWKGAFGGSFGANAFDALVSSLFLTVIYAASIYLCAWLVSRLHHG